jgi:hypothetical protein
MFFHQCSDMQHCLLSAACEMEVLAEWLSPGHCSVCMLHLL